MYVKEVNVLCLLSILSNCIQLFLKHIKANIYIWVVILFEMNTSFTFVKDYYLKIVGNRRGFTWTF